MSAKDHRKEPEQPADVSKNVEEEDFETQVERAFTLSDSPAENSEGQTEDGNVSDAPHDLTEGPTEDQAEDADEPSAGDFDARAIFDGIWDTAAEEKNTTGMPEMAPPLLVVCFVVCIFVSSIVSYRFGYERSLQDQQAAQQEVGDDAGEATTSVNQDLPVVIPEHEVTLPPAEMTVDMQKLYEENEDIVGWLKIDGMKIDYPVMQSMYDEEYYLNRDFNKNDSLNGCLIMDTDSVVGTGTAANDYKDGTEPSKNLIIHGHNMKNGDMFGDLDKFRDKSFYETHKIIQLQTLYEDREYEIISVFLSQVYLKSQTDVFKYYKFFQANTEKEFDDFYDNIKKLALYDTGVDAEFGDEFITLSVCAYHVENGRLAVVGKRIR